MDWRMSSLALAVATVAAAACSDAALLAPRVHDEERGGSGSTTSPESGVAAGGIASGGYESGTGGVVGAGGSTSSGGASSSGGVDPGTGGRPGGAGPTFDGGASTGGSTGAGGLSGCEGGGRSLEDYCRSVQCNDLHQAAPLCYEAAGEGRLVSVVVGCGYARIEMQQNGSSPFVGGATWALDTGQVVEAFQTAENGDCMGHKGEFIRCDAWESHTCDTLFGDGGVAPGPHAIAR